VVISKGKTVPIKLNQCHSCFYETNSWLRGSPYIFRQLRLEVHDLRIAAQRIDRLRPRSPGMRDQHPLGIRTLLLEQVFYAQFLGIATDVCVLLKQLLLRCRPP
jgi:hypothetical protein